MRFWTVIFPLLSPTAFFLLVVNLVYAFFDTSASSTLTQGGSRQHTETLITVYVDGVNSPRLIRRAIGGADGHRHRATAIQFRFIERRITDVGHDGRRSPRRRLAPPHARTHPDHVVDLGAASSRRRSDHADRFHPRDNIGRGDVPLPGAEAVHNYATAWSCGR